MENRTGVLQQVSSAIKPLKTVFQKGDIHTKIYDLELGITLDAQNDPIDLLETAFSMAEKLAKKDNKRMVILLDEFQELDRLSEPHLLKRLRAIFQQQEQTSYFFLGSGSSVLNTIFADRRQAFYRFATLIELPTIPEDEWKKYIKKKLSKLNITITDRALNMLLEKTGGHPYCVMSIMTNAYVYAKLNEIDEIDAEILFVAYEHSLFQLDAIYEEHWQEIRRFKGADVVLASVLLDSTIFKKDNTNGTRAVQNLIRLSVIKKTNGRGKYELLEPMFGDWLLRKTQL